MALFNATMPDRAADAASEDAAEWIASSAGAWRWQVRRDWIGLLNGDAPDWLKLERDARARLVKANDGRQVWRVQLGGRLVYAKIARPPRQWARLRHLLFGPDSVHEARIARYAAEQGIQTVRPIGLAFAPLDGHAPSSILITAGLPHARPLNQLWEELCASSGGVRARKDALIDAVARLLAHAHQCGFEHYDLHAGNVLVDLQGGGLRPLFVDLHNVRIGRPVGDAEVTRNLSQFNQWFRLHAPVTDRIRFLHRYLDWRERSREVSPHARALGVNRRTLVRQLDRAARTHAQSLYGKRDRRALRTGRYFARLRVPGGWRGHVFLEAKHPLSGSRAAATCFTVQQWRDWLARPLDLLQPADQRRILKQSAGGLVCRATLPHPDGAVEVVCKRGAPRGLAKRLLSVLRRSRALLTWTRGNALLHRQLPTARPLAVLEKRRWGMLVDSLVITEQVEHAIDLDTLLVVTLREMPADQQRQAKAAVGRALVRLMRDLLAVGLVHRDFKAPNIIVQWSPMWDRHSAPVGDRHPAGQCGFDPAARDSADPPRIVLVDLDGLTRVRFSPARAGLHMLARLNVSLDHCRRVMRTDRLRFLHAFLNRPGSRDDEWKAAWRTIACLSERKRLHRDRDQQRKFAKYGRF